MTRLYLLMAIAGLCAGAWPLVMKPAHLTGGAIAVSYSIFSLLMALYLFAVMGKMQIAAPSEGTIGWWWAIVSSLFAAAAVLIVSIVIPQARAEDLGKLYVVTLIAQMSVPAVYHVAINLIVGHSVNLRQIAGLITAFAAAMLLM